MAGVSHAPLSSAALVLLNFVSMRLSIETYLLSFFRQVHFGESKSTTWPILRIVSAKSCYVMLCYVLVIVRPLLQS